MILFSSISGTTRRVARHVGARLGDKVIIDAHTALNTKPDLSASYLVLLCPTYGDEEPEDDFEKLLINYDWSTHRQKGFAFCELGVYTGYENFGHGLANLVCATLESHGLNLLLPPLAIDAMPITDWNLIDVWTDTLRVKLMGTK